MKGCNGSSQTTAAKNKKSGLATSLRLLELSREKKRHVRVSRGAGKGTQAKFKRWRCLNQISCDTISVKKIFNC